MDILFHLSFHLTVLTHLVIGVHFGHRETKCHIDGSAIVEASGLAISRVHLNVAYTHNDKGGSAEIFAVDLSNGKTVATLNIKSAINWDWEDLAYGPCVDDCTSGHVCSAALEPSRFCLYIADIGDHGGDGAANHIYVIREPATLGNKDVDLVGQLKFTWTEQDAETLMISPDARLFIVSKVNGGHAKLAQIPSSAWNSNNVVRLDMSHTATLRISTSSNDPQGGDISPDGMSMLLVGEHDIYFYSVTDGDYIKAIRDQVPKKVDTYNRVPSTEGIAWAPNQRSFYIIPDGNHPSIYSYPVDLTVDEVFG
nr:CAunnamed protein product [Biomphalaria glabrata]